MGNYARFVDLGNGACSDNIILYRMQTSNDLAFSVFRGCSQVTLVTAPGAITLNEWQHFVATMTSAGEVTLYRNGVQVGHAINQTLPAAAINRTSNYIGKSNWSSDAYYAGAMDEVAIYPTALTSSQVAAHIAASGATPPTAPASLTGVPGTNSVSLSWTPSTAGVYPGQLPVQGYVVSAHKGALYAGYVLSRNNWRWRPCATASTCIHLSDGVVSCDR